MLGIAAAPIEFGLEPTDDDLRRTGELIGDAARPLLGVILGSSWESRIYFAQPTAQTITELHRRQGLTPVLMGAPEERALADEVRGFRPVAK